MNAKSIIRRSAAQLGKGNTDLERLRHLSDEEIDSAASHDQEAAAIDIDWSEAELVLPVAKKPISLRLDEDIIAYFQTLGPGYQTRINAVLRHYVEHKRRNG